MKKITNSIFALFMMIVTVNAFAEPNQEQMTQEIASILIKFEFYPNFSEKQFLRNVSMDETATHSQRTIAATLANFQHRPSHQDREKLEVVLNDETATVSEQQLAYIIHRLKFKPSEADKALLKKILQQ